jgi:hypothetical protein
MWLCSSHKQARDAEVEHLHEVRVPIALHQHDVLGLHVAVHDALPVRGPHAHRRGVGDAQTAREREVAVFEERLRQRAPLEVLHDQIEAAVGELAEQVDVHQVGVVERRRHACLTLEAPHGVGVLGEVAVQDLDRHVALQGGLMRTVDRAHAARPDGLVHVELLQEPRAHQRVGRHLLLHQRAPVQLTERRRSVIGGAALGADLGVLGHRRMHSLAQRMPARQLYAPSVSDTPAPP